MIRSITKDIVCVANGQKLETFVTGRKGVKQVVKEIWQEVTTNVFIRGYLDQDRIVDVAGECNVIDYKAIPVDVEVADGEVFQAGFAEDAGGSPTLPMTVFVEETPG